MLALLLWFINDFAEYHGWFNANMVENTVILKHVYENR